MNEIELRAATGTRVWRLAVALVALLVAATLWRAAVADPELASARGRLAFATAIAGALFVWALASWRSRFVLDPEGVTQKTAFSTRRLRWDEVDGLVHGYVRCSILGGTRDGRRRRVSFSGGRDQERAILAQVLARAPRLGAIAWGLGIDGVERPRERAPILPERLELVGTTLLVHGPKSLRLRFAADRDDYARRIECARERLARLMLGEPVDAVCGGVT